MELDALSGSRLAYAVFDLDGSGDIDSSDAVNIGGDDTGHGGGMRINDFVSTPYVLETGGETEYKYMSGASGNVTVVEESSGNVNLGRQSWRQLR
jgi:type IV pilus assembly protein PilY1